MLPSYVFLNIGMLFVTYLGLGFIVVSTFIQEHNFKSLKSTVLKFMVYNVP